MSKLSKIQFTIYKQITETCKKLHILSCQICVKSL